MLDSVSMVGLIRSNKGRRGSSRRDVTLDNFDTIDAILDYIQHLSPGPEPELPDPQLPGRRNAS